MIRACLFASAALALAGCASQPSKPSEPVAGGDVEMATRISRICALPEPERSREIEKLKKESGLVLYCGQR